MGFSVWVGVWIVTHGVFARVVSLVCGGICSTCKSHAHAVVWASDWSQITRVLDTALPSMS